jgi:hypothetical protein
MLQSFWIPVQSHLLPYLSWKWGFGSLMVAVRVRVCGGAARATPESLRQDLHDHKVGYIVFIVNAYAEA